MNTHPLNALAWALPDDLAGKTVLFAGAQPLDGLEGAVVTCLQTFYPYVRALEHRGRFGGDAVRAEWPNGILYDYVLLLPPQNIQALQYQIAQAFLRLADDGVLIVVAGNDAGGKRLGKLMAALGVSYGKSLKISVVSLWCANSMLMRQSYRIG